MPSTTPTTFVLGSNSFSGQDFVDLLLAETDHRVIGVSRSPEKSSVFLSYLDHPEANDRFAFHQLDLNDDFDALVELIQREKPRFIVNFAAQSEVAPSWLHPEQWATTNVVALAKLGNFLRQCDWLERYVHISSPEAYGTCEGTVKEGHPDNPSTPYAASKSAGDMFLSTYVKQYGFPCVTIRATNVYGPHQQLFKIIPRSAIYLKLGKTIELHGGGHAVKSYIHIRDVSRGELFAMLQGTPGEMYHLSPTEGVAVRDVVKNICEAAGTPFEQATKIVDERPGQDKAYVIDSSKARAQFNWHPKVSLQHGLAEVFAWVDRDWDRIQHLPLAYEHKA
ncbi:MAG: GDP-mannose 4,6-dehydratase [Planctomycetota bacterium]